MLTMHELNKRILQSAQQGLARLVFLKRLSEELISYTGCDALELRLADELLQYIWHYAGSGESGFRKCSFKTSADGYLIPCLENGSINEQVCEELFRERYNPELKFHYRKQSILVDDAYHDQRYIDQSGNTLGKETKYGSLIYVSFVTNQDIPGLLILKKRESSFFSRDDELLYENLAQILGIAIAFRRSQFALDERVKELTCLHSISKLLQEEDLTWAETFQKLVKLIPASFQYPELTGCRLQINRKSYKSHDFPVTSKKMSQNIFLGRERVGEITVSIQNPELDFLIEEYDLLSSIAGATGVLYRKLQSEEEKREIEERLRQADRLATIGQLAAGIAHELNEPLSNILGYAQLIEGDLPKKSSVSEDLSKIISSSLHAREIVRKLLLFARQMPINKTQVNINEIIQESLQIVSSRFAKHNIQLKLDLDGALPDIMADSSQLKQVVINLLVNAEQAMPDGGKLKISTQNLKQNIEIEIKDSGTGMSKSVQKKIFLPFFTTKESGEGTGLGLAVVDGIVKAHGGSIKVRSAIDEGTCVTLSFPIPARAKR